MKTTEAYKKIYSIRKAEEVIAEYYYNNKIFSFVHFYIGQEAVAVGVCENLTSDDRLFGNHRSHGHYLAKGGDLVAMYSEMLGRASGCCRGKGGSMHMLDRSVGFMGSTPILASAVPIAAGSALNQKLSKSNNITAVFYGDGASEEGIVYETMNLAATLSLPLLMVLEDNLYSVCTPHEDRRAKDYCIDEIAGGFGVKFIKANGNDFLNVYEAANAAINYVKEMRAPCVLYCQVFRHMAHSAPIRDDKSGYRKIDTEEVRRREDSLLKLRANVVSQYGEEEIIEIERQIDLKVSEALTKAVSSPEPNANEMMIGVYHE